MFPSPSWIGCSFSADVKRVSGMKQLFRADATNCIFYETRFRLRKTVVIVSVIECAAGRDFVYMYINLKLKLLT